MSFDTVCLNYSIARGGALVAYRWSREAKLTSENLHAVPNPASGSQASRNLPPIAQQLNEAETKVSTLETALSIARRQGDG